MVLDNTQNNQSFKAVSSLQFESSIDRHIYESSVTTLVILSFLMLGLIALLVKTSFMLKAERNHLQTITDNLAILDKDKD
jgi:hypothetical protein